ncbi:MAG: hypothetical protein RIC95_09730 [Vicingaceae bacterium]
MKTNLLRLLQHLILLFLVSFNTVLCAQAYKEYWGNDSMKLEGHIRNSERDGQWKRWYPNGQLEYKGSYIMGIPEGTWTYFCKHGYLEKVIKWEKGRCYDIVDYFLSGEPSVYLHFDEGLSTQQYLEYYKIDKWAKENQLKITLNRALNANEDSLVHFRFVPLIIGNRVDPLGFQDKYSRHKDSVVIVEMYKNRYLIEFCKSLSQEFVYKEYFYQGAGLLTNMTHLVKRFEDSVLLDLETDYYEVEPFGRYKEKLVIDNKLIHKTSFDINKPNDQNCTTYHESGEYESVAFYKNGKKEGKVRYFDESGKLIRKEKYKEGKRIK